MNAKLSSKQRASRSYRGETSKQLRYKHLAFGVGLALGSLLVCGMASAAGAVASNQSPTGGKVVGGTGSITQNGASTIVNQQSKLLALDWQTFNVGKDASVLFNQPGTSAIALNRILDQNPSQIFGKVTSNGQIFLINTHGIIFGASAQLNVGGLVASTLDLTPQDFLKEHFSLDAHGASAGVVNHGTIAAASGGSVSLIGGQVANDGLIVADYGHINLDGADTAVLDFDGNGLISVEITGALQQRFDADKAAVSNNGTLKAASGTVVLQASAAKNLFTDMVNNSGVIKAGGISTAGGEVRLVGSGGNATNSGSIDVSGTQGGSVQVLSDHDVGMSGSIHADASWNGDGGNILVKGDGSADISGTLTARGGAQGGNGGFIETSGAHVHIADSTRINTLAAFGQAGTWLIDPTDFIIKNSGGDMTPTALQNALGGGNVSILSSNGAGGTAGNIDVDNNVTWGSNTLTLTAANNINIKATLKATGSAGLTLQPGTANGSDAAVPGGTTIITSTGELSLAGTGAMSIGSLTADGTFDISGLAGNLTIQSLAGAGSGRVKLGGNDLTLNNSLVAIGANNTFAGIISGNGAVALTGGMQAFSGANTYQGGTTISGGTLQVADDGGLGDSAGDVTITNGTLQAGGDITSDRVVKLTTGSTAHIDTNGHAVILNGDIKAPNSSTGVLEKDGTGTLTLTGNNSQYKTTNVNAGTLALSGSGALGGKYFSVASGAIFDISQATTGATVYTLNGAGTVNLGSKILTIGAGNTAWAFSGVLADGGIGGGTGGSLVMDDGVITGVLSGTSTYTGDTTIKNGTLSVSSDANLGVGGDVILNGGTLENTASFTLNHALSTGSNGGTLQNDTSTTLTVANAITGTGDLTQNGPGTLAINANVTTTGATQSYNGTLALGNAVTLTGTTVNLGTVTGNGHDLTVAGNAVLNGVATVPNLNVTGSGNELNFGTAGSVSGNVDSATLDYDNYATAVTFDTAIGTGTTTGIGGTWSGVGSVIGNGTDSSATGIGPGTFLLSGSQAGTVGTIDFTGFTAADAWQVAGAAGFDDAAKSSEGITFTNAIGVFGGGTVSNVGGNFDDGAGKSSVSGITYTGFGMIAGTSSGSVTNVTGSFDDGARKSSVTGLVYTGFAAVDGTSSGHVTGVTGDFDDGAGQSSASSITYSGFGFVDGLGSASVTNVTGNFDDGTGQSSVSGVIYSGFGTVVGTTSGHVTDVTSDFDDGTGQSSATSVAYSGFGFVDGTGSGTVSNVVGNFDDLADKSSASGITYTGFGTIAGTNAGSVTNVIGSFDDDTRTSAASGLIYTGFGAVTGTGGSVTGVTGDFDVVTDTSSASNIDYSGFGLTTVAGNGTTAGIIGLGATTFTLTGTQLGSANGITFSGFATADTSQVAGAAGFDDGAQSSEGMIFANATDVSGSGTVSNVVGNFDDGADKSSASGITYTGFGTIAGTSGGSVTNVLGNFDDGAGQSSASGLIYTGFGTVAGSGGSVTNVTGSFDDGTGESSVSGVAYTGFGAVTGSGGSVTDVTGDFDVDSDVSSASGIDYSGFGLVSVAGSGNASTLTGAGDTYTLTGANAGGVNGFNFAGFRNILDAAGTVDFGSAGSVGGDITASVLDYGSFASAVTVNLSGAGTTGVGGTVTGVSSITSQQSLAVTGASASNLSLTTTGAGATTALGGLTVNGNLGVDSNGAVTQGGAGPLQVTGTTAINAHANAITLDDTGNDLSGTVSLTNSGANDVVLDNGTHALTLGNVNVGTGTLDIRGTGITQVAGTGVVQAPGAGAASFDAHAGVLNLNSTLNNFTGIVNLANSGNNLVYLDNGGHALTLGTLNVGSGPLTITDYGIGALLLTDNITTNGGAVSFGGDVTIDGAPTIAIDTTGGGAAGANISFGGNVNGAAANADSLALTAGNGGVNFGGAVGNTAALKDLTSTSKTFGAASTLGIGGNLSITTTAGPISQGGAWSVGGTSTLDAGSNAITLANASNNFGGLITATGGAVELAGTGTLDMGAVTATSLKLDGASLLHEDITTTGAQNYNGAVTLDGSGSSVALHGNGISFASTVDNLASANPQDFTVDSGTGAAQFNGAVGSINGPLGALVVSGTGQAQFLGNVAAASLTATAPVLLDASVSTSGDQKYNGAVALGTNVVAASSNGDVTFTSTVDNAVAGTPESLTVTAANGAATFGNAVGTLNGPLGNLTSSSGTFNATGALDIGGDLNVTTTAGAIAQSAAWTVAGNSVFDAGNNAVTLSNPGNDFTGTVTVTGAGVAVTDTNDLTIGGLTDNNNGNVSLIAGGQLNGVGPINAGTGSITLTAAGAVLTTAALTGGDIALTGGSGITIGDDVNASGSVTLTATAGNISEGSTAVITADTLTGTSSGSTHLDGVNQFANVGNFTANGFSLTNGQAITIASGIKIDGGAGGTALTTTNGDITVNGTVGNASGATSLVSAGDINEGAGGVVIATQLTGSSVGDTTLTGVNKIASVGQFNAVNFTLVDNAALSVVGPLLTTGDISLTTTGGPANVLNVGQALTGGSVTLNSAGDLSITQTVQGSAVDLTANGNLSIDAAVNSGAGATTLTQNGAGSISEGVGGSITAGSLTGTAQGGATLDGANAVASLGNFTAVGFSLTNATDLTVAAGSTVDGGANTSLTTTGAGSDLAIDGNVNGTTTTLVSAGTINEGASGVVTADTLTGSSVGATSLGGNNAIAKLGNFTAANFALNDGQSLTILAGNTVDGGSSTALTVDGDLDIDGTLKGTTTTLDATGAINEGAGGGVVAGTLTGNSGGATNLSGNNAVSSLGNFSADGFALTTNQALTVNAGATVDGGASTALTTTGSGNGIGINGTVQGDLITLVSAGAISEGSGGLVQGGDLTGSSVGDANFSQAQINQLDAFNSANFSLSNAGALSVAGPLTTTGNAGDISLTTTGAGNALTVNQAVQGAAITLASAGDLTVANAVTGTQVGLAANGNLAIDAAVSSGAGTTTLTQTGDGAITSGANGSITAAILTGSATGATTLGSAGQFMANHVDTLGGFSSPAGFSFTNDGTLTLASVGGSAFTVDAGKAALYLEVRNGDLLQIGNNWLYDGSGTWAAPEGHIGSQIAPIYVTGVSAQSVPAIGFPPAYFYAVDYSGNLLPLTGSNAINVPGAILQSKSQGTNGHTDQYIDISVVTATYRPYGIVPTGLLLPPDQSACSPDQPPSDLCPENN